MNKLVVLAALIMALAGCGGSGTSSVPVGTVTVAPGTWKGAVSVSTANSIFTNYSVRLKLTQQTGVNVFGSYSSHPWGGYVFTGGGPVQAMVTDYVVTFTEPSSLPPTYSFLTPAGCTTATGSPVILTNNSAGTDILSINFTGSYLCNGTTYGESWMATLFKQP